MKRMAPLEVFEYLDEKWKWIAMDGNGTWAAYDWKPERLEDCYTTQGTHWDSVEIPIAIDFGGPWEESLFERPKKTVKYFISERGVSLYRPMSIFHAFDLDAPPEVAEWFHKIMEEKK